MRRLGRAVWRGLIEPALVAAGVARVRRATLGGRVLVLAYHNIVPAGERPVGERSLHLPQRAFAEQLDELTATHDIVPLPAMLDAASGARPRAVITFDDAYRGAMTIGLDEIASRGLPATVFVAPGIVGSKSMWWDMFADPASGEMERSFRDAALTSCRGMNDEVIAFAAHQRRSAIAMPEWAGICGEEDLARAATQPRISFGAHSWSHANLAAIAEREVENELGAPIGWLRERFGNTFAPWMAWPYGLHSAVAAGAIRDRYQGAFLVTGGYVSSDHLLEQSAIPRFNVPAGISLNAFVLRAAGLFARQ